MMVYSLHSSRTEDTEEIGKAIAKALSAAGIKRAFIALYGEMGVGKTAFVRGFSSAFGLLGVRSPTFTVVNEYGSPKSDTRIFHFDLYRIESEDDLYSVGFDDYLAKDGYCITEWSENMEGALPEDRVRVTISRTGNDASERRIVLDPPDGFPADFSALPHLISKAER